MQSVMTNRFAENPKVNIPRSTFKRSFGYKTTFDAGKLVPFYVDEALPGDTFNLKVNGFARLSTPIFPIMDNMRLDTHFFAVPIRLLWDNWQKFCGEQTDPGDSIDYTIPTMTSPAGGYANESLQDYLGIPTKIASLTHSALFTRAYNYIFNEWYRSQDLQDSVTVDKGDGPDTHSDYVLLNRNKRHDYFTSCLPWLQKGDSVDLPLGTSAPLSGSLTHTGDGTNMVVTHGGNNANLRVEASSVNISSYVAAGGSDESIKWNNPAITAHDLSAYTADLSSATAATVNQLREAFQVQKILERDARGGTRYVEIIKSHFGVTSPDSRVQRPEYLGGGSSPVVVSPIAQTSSTDATTPQGNLAAMATANFERHGFVKSFSEHCIVIGIVSARADLTYQQGLDRMFSRSTRYDYYWPSLAHIGEQAVLNKEIYAKADSNDDKVFGYQERFAEYRYKPSKITGKFRSNDTNSLDAWHLSQEFSSLPTLGDTFIQENPPVDRVVAVPTEPHFIFDSYCEYTCARPMPVNSIPGLTDHF
jgi:hypothetical protein